MREVHRLGLGVVGVAAVDLVEHGLHLEHVVAKDQLKVVRGLDRDNLWPRRIHIKQLSMLLLAT